MPDAPRKHLIAIPVLFLLYFYGINRVGVLSHDEPRYASIGREMAESGDWVTPRLWGEPWFEKPTLLYWLIGSGYKANLGDDLAPRVPVAIVCVAFLFFYFHQLRREFGENAALYSAMILSTTAGWLAFGQIAVTDLPMSATFAAAMLLCLPWIRSGGRRGLLIGGVLLGLSVLAKGFVPIVLAAPLVWVGRRRWKDLLMFAGAALAVALPWYLLCWQVNGQVFFDEFIWKHHLARFLSDDLQHVQPWWFYLPVFCGLLFPWTPALVLLLRKQFFADPRRQLLLGWLLFGFLFFTLSRNKLPGYVLPLLPAACALIGIELAEGKRGKWVIPLAGLSVALIPIAAGVLPRALVFGLSRSPLSGASYPALLLGLILAGLCVLAERQGRRTAAVSLVTAGMLAGVVYTKVVAYPELDRVASARTLWKSIESRKEDVCIDEIRRSWRYGLNFYSHDTISPCARVPARYRITADGDGLPQVISFPRTL